MAVSERFQGANMIDAGRLSPYWGEHAARYVFALPFVEGKAVLDIACGTGYGLGLMKRIASHVTGVDISPEAAREAANECDGNASVLLANGLGLPFDDGTFDVVTSFETLEHLHDRAGFVAELRRILKKGGILLLSTPNADYSKPVNGKPTNPFHVHEYTPGELEAELAAEFAIERMLSQSLTKQIRVSPFYEGQKRMSKDLSTQSMLLGWKVCNKLPFSFRERMSDLVWGRPFYPTEADYVFAEEIDAEAPTLLAVCRREK